MGEGMEFAWKVPARYLSARTLCDETSGCTHSVCFRCGSETKRVRRPRHNRMPCDDVRS